MFKRHREQRAFSGQKLDSGQDYSFSSQNTKNSSFTTVKTIGYSAKLPKPTRHNLGYHQDPTFSKLIPTGILHDLEKLVEENLEFNFQTTAYSNENLRLKARLQELVQAQFIDGTQAVFKLKSAMRDLQQKLLSIEADYLNLKKILKSSKISEYENKIESYANEANRLKFLLEKLLSQEAPLNINEYESNRVELALELQALRKENGDLSQSAAQALRELDILHFKMNSLEKKKTNKQLSSKIKKFVKVKETLLCEKIELSNVISGREKEINDKVLELRDAGKNILLELEVKEKRMQEQLNLIEETKRQFEQYKIVSKAKRNQTFIPFHHREELIIKLANPPRILVKMNQILRRKKMLVVVLLSLLDKNSNGLIHISNFESGMASFGQKIKAKHIEELSRLFGGTITYIPVRKLEELYEKYSYSNDFYPSSEEETPLKKKEKTTPSPPTRSPTLTVSQNMNKPEAKLPSPPKEILSRVIPTVSINEIFLILEEIKEKMIRSNLKKMKIAYGLFGNSFDPDELLTLDAIESYLQNSILNLSNGEQLRLLSRYLIEPDGATTMKENEAKNLKGCIRDIVRKLQKILPDWELFTDAEVAEFKKRFSDIMFKFHNKILSDCRAIDKNEEFKIEFKEFILIVKDQKAELTEKMAIWLQGNLKLKSQSEKFDYLAYLNDFKELEPNFIVKEPPSFVSFTKTQKTEILGKILQEIALKANEFPEVIFEPSLDSQNIEDFIETLTKIGVSLASSSIFVLIDEFESENKGHFRKMISIAKLVVELKKFGYIEKQIHETNTVLEINEAIDLNESNEIQEINEVIGFSTDDPVLVYSSAEMSNISLRNRDALTSLNNVEFTSNYEAEKSPQEIDENFIYSELRLKGKPQVLKISEQEEISSVGEEYKENEDYSEEDFEKDKNDDSESAIPKTKVISNDDNSYYSNSFEENESIGEAINEYVDNESELEFIDYGISIEK